MEKFKLHEFQVNISRLIVSKLEFESPLQQTNNRFFSVDLGEFIGYSSD